MEIVPIITYLLLFAVALLLFVLAISILFSNSHHRIDRGGQNLIQTNTNTLSSQEKLYNSIEVVPSFSNERLPAGSRNSQIFYMNKGREENMKSFSTQVKYQEQYRNTTDSRTGKTRTQGTPRFTIINDKYSTKQYSSYNSSESNYKYLRTADRYS